MTIEELTAEVEVLRRTNADLLTKRAKQRDTIASLEATEIDLRGQIEKLNQRVKTVGVEIPITRMMNALSNTPNVLQEQVAKSYRFEAGENGDVIMTTADGKPVQTDASGKALPVTEQSLSDFLLQTPEKAVFSHLLKVRASGGGARNQGRGALQSDLHHNSPETPPKQPSPYGLR